MNRAVVFLRAYAECGNVTRAADAAKISRSIHYRRLEEDPQYAAAFERAKELAKHNLSERAAFRLLQIEDALYERAVDGWLEPVTFQGEFCYEPLYDDEGNVVRDAEGKPRRGKQVCIRKFSDSNAQFLARGLAPEKYRERFNGPRGGGELTLKFKGSLEELLITYRNIVREEAEDEPEAA